MAALGELSNAASICLLHNYQLYLSHCTIPQCRSTFITTTMKERSSSCLFMSTALMLFTSSPSSVSSLC